MYVCMCIYIHVWITGVEAIKRQTRAAYGSLIVGRAGVQPIGCTPALSVTKKALLQLRNAACGAI